MLRIAALAVLIVGACAACEGGTSGSVIGGRESCRRQGQSGACEGSWRKLSGTYGQDIEDEMIFSGDAVRTEVTVSVESGTVEVSVESPEGEISSAQATPGQPATLRAVAQGESDGFEVRFKAVDGEALNVSYTVTYEVE